MIADQVARYLEGERTTNDDILGTMMRRFGAVTFRQLMEPTAAPRINSYPPSAATKCPRANYGAWIGAPSEPFAGKTRRTFYGGDIAELVTIGLAQLAFLGTRHSIGLNNEQVDIPLGTQGKIRKGYIDGMITYNHDEAEAAGFAPCRPRRAEWVDANGNEDLLVEFKSMDDFPFELFQKDGPDDTWGYLGQVTVYQRALHLRRYVMVAVHRGSLEVAEYIGTYSNTLAAKADANFDAVMLGAEANTPPPMPTLDGYGRDASGLLKLKCSALW